MSFALDLFTVIAVAAGVVFFLAGTLGLLRFPDVYSRLHALAKADNLGLGCVLLGLALEADNLAAALKRFQSFPDDYRWPEKTSWAQGWARVGNSVPPLMMYAVARCVRQKLGFQ